MTVLMLGKQLELGHYRTDFLESYGIHVIFPESKQQAMAAIRAGGYDVVILSYTLSDETAKQAAELKEQVCPDCPLIFISAQRWDGRNLRPDGTVLHTDPPQALLEALRRVQVRQTITDNFGAGIRRVK